jgi:hypothetical protein
MQAERKEPGAAAAAEPATPASAAAAANGVPDIHVRVQRALCSGNKAAPLGPIPVPVPVREEPFPETPEQLQAKLDALQNGPANGNGNGHKNGKGPTPSERLRVGPPPPNDYVNPGCLPREEAYSRGPFLPIPADVAFDQITGFVLRVLKKHHQEWDPMSKQKMISTIYIGASQRSLIAPWNSMQTHEEQDDAGTE